MILTLCLVALLASRRTREWIGIESAAPGSRAPPACFSGSELARYCTSNLDDSARSPIAGSGNAHEENTSHGWAEYTRDFGDTAGAAGIAGGAQQHRDSTGKLGAGIHLNLGAKRTDVLPLYAVIYAESRCGRPSHTPTGGDADIRLGTGLLVTSVNECYLATTPKGRAQSVAIRQSLPHQCVLSIWPDSTTCLGEGQAYLVADVEPFTCHWGTAFKSARIDCNVVN